MTTKTKIFAICLVALMQSIPAYAVTEPIKVLQYSIRDVHKVIEVIQNVSSLVSSVQNAILQGSLAIVKSIDFKQITDLKSFAPSVPEEIQSLVDAGNAVPKVRDYIETELKNVSFTDVIEQRDALLDVSRRLNDSSVKAISLGKKIAAELNEAPKINEKMIAAAAGAINQQQKETQEAAFALKAMAEDAVLNQLHSSQLEAQAQKIVADIRKAAITQVDAVKSSINDIKGNEKDNKDNEKEQEDKE